MSNLISRQALCEYALNQKDKSITPNDIMRFPSTQPEPCVDTIDALDESIKHFDDMAEECRRNANIEQNDYMDMRDDAAEYRQLSIWLNELKWLRERFQSQPDSKETSSTHKALDTISRQAAIDAMCELMHHWFGGDPKDEIREIKRELENLPSAQPETHEERTETHACDLISRRAAIDALVGVTMFKTKHEIMQRVNASVQDEQGWLGAVAECLDEIEDLPSAQTDLSEYSDKLWKAACERGKAEALDEIVRCKDCKHQVKEWRDDKRLKDKGYWVCGCEVVGDACGYWALLGQDEDFCSYAERRTDESD